MTTRPTLTIDELRSEIESGAIDTVITAFEDSFDSAWDRDRA